MSYQPLTGSIQGIDLHNTCLSEGKHNGQYGSAVVKVAIVVNEPLLLISRDIISPYSNGKTGDEILFDLDF